MNNDETFIFFNFAFLYAIFLHDQSVQGDGMFYKRKK